MISTVTQGSDVANVHVNPSHQPQDKKPETPVAKATPVATDMIATSTKMALPVYKHAEEMITAPITHFEPTVGSSLCAYNFPTASASRSRGVTVSASAKPKEAVV